MHIFFEFMGMVLLLLLASFSDAFCLDSLVLISFLVFNELIYLSGAVYINISSNAP